MNVEQFHERLGELYLPPKGQFTLVDVPEVRYAVIEGKGDPEKGKSADIDGTYSCGVVINCWKRRFYALWAIMGSMA